MLLALTFLLAVLSGTPLSAKAKKEKPRVGSAPAVLWREPVDIATRNLFYGQGGKEHEPQGKLVYEKENLQGVNPKFDVRDSAGVKWGVKLGDEARPEVAAGRLVWAVGYFTDEYYYLPEINFTRPPALHRGTEMIKNGKVVGVRLKRYNKRDHKIGYWSWNHNPFAGSKELNGLRIMMELICNTDLKPEHLVIYDVNHVEQRYYIKDLGGSFGKAGLGFTRTKGVLRDYQQRPLIRRVSGNYVDFWYFKHIPKADARWIGGWLSRLSDEQIKDAFRAGGFSPSEVNGFAAKVRKKINELNKL
ncbi:MAG: hypothetical protein ACM3SW_02710 [Actinomycetota bacterium]